MKPAISVPTWLLRLEGIAVAIVSGISYSKLYHGSWWPFILLFLTPDLFMIGYLKDVKFGAICYNVVHTYITPVILAGILVLSGNMSWLWIASIWTAHIGFDRALGFGLKYPTDFQDTHLQRL